MRHSGLGLILAVALASSAQERDAVQAARVPDSVGAISIARHAAIKVYGKHQIDYEEPLTASLDDGIWTVYGTLCCPDRKGKRTCEVGRCVGGVVNVRIRQHDGKILSMTHSK